MFTSRGNFVLIPFKMRERYSRRNSPPMKIGTARKLSAEEAERCCGWECWERFQTRHPEFSPRLEGAGRKFVPRKNSWTEPKAVSIGGRIVESDDDPFLGKTRVMVRSSSSFYRDGVVYDTSHAFALAYADSENDEVDVLFAAHGTGWLFAAEGMSYSYAADRHVVFDSNDEAVDWLLKRKLDDEALRYFPACFNEV